MSFQVQITLRTRKLGVLIRDARISARRTVSELANSVGVSSGILNAFEEGRKAPSLPELELLAYSLQLPIQHFWSSAALTDDGSHTDLLNLIKLVELRNRIIGTLLRQKRLETNVSLKSLGQETGIHPGRLKTYELGERAVPLPELEAILSVLGGRVETFFDQNGPVGKWMTDQAAIQEFLKLSPELRAFVCMSVNRPYLELALKLSQLPTARLRSVAESLLDITL